MEEKSKLIGKLFHSRDTAHLYHLSVIGKGSFAKHLASQEYYTSILELTDTLVESCQYEGIYNITIPNSYTEVAKEFPNYLSNLLKEIESQKAFTASDSLNILDEIKTLIKQTLYKITYLE